MNNHFYLVVVFFVSLEIHHRRVWAVPFLEDTTITAQQAEKLKKFKENVEPHLYQDWMKEEMYLVRFLRAQKFDLPRAEEMLLNHLRWRKDIRLDEAHEEDWSFFQKEYPYYFDGKDREGRPVVVIPYGDWNIRRAAVAGQIRQLTRYMFKIIDEGGMKVRELARNGGNVTRWSIVVSCENVNAVQHMTPGGIQFALTVVAAYDPQFPGIVEELFLINGVFESVVALMRPLLSEETNKIFNVYGKGQSVWGPPLYKKIDPSELPFEFGGTKFYE